MKHCWVELLKYKVQIHREVIRYINITDELIPEIIISTSNDKKVKLTELKTGKYIETLKQISIKYNPIPIGIKYLKDNPFKPSKNNKKEYNTIYLKDISLPLKKPRIIYVDLLTDDEPIIQPEDFCGNAIKTTNYTM